MAIIKSIMFYTEIYLIFVTNAFLRSQLFITHYIIIICNCSGPYNFIEIIL